MTPVFVETVPAEKKLGELYVSPRFRTVVHSCACGCGVEINTPLHPTGWKMTFDGVNVSLSPSVGNWSEECQSHYWIERNRVIWAGRWTQTQIDQERQNRKSEIADYYERDSRKGWIRTLRDWFRR